MTLKSQANDVVSFRNRTPQQAAAAVCPCPCLQVEQEPDEQGRAIAVNYWYDMKFDARQAYLQARALFGVICNSFMLGVRVALQRSGGQRPAALAARGRVCLTAHNSYLALACGQVIAAGCHAMCCWLSSVLQRPACRPLSGWPS